MRPLAGLLSLPLCVLSQTPASRPSQERETGASLAFAALEEGLRSSRPGASPESLPSSLAPWAQSARKAYVEFAAKVPGTAAAALARLRAAALLAHAEERTDEALGLLDALAEELRGTRGREALLSEALLTAGLLLRGADRESESRARLEEVVALRGDLVAVRAAESALRLLEAAARVRPGEAAPPFGAKALDGRDVSRDGLRGRVLLLDFWASWSPLWRGSLPALRDLYAARRERGFEIVGVCLDPAERFERVALPEFLRAEQLSWPQIFDGTGLRSPLARSFAVESVPTSFLLDRKGRIRYRDLRGEELGRRVEELLAEPSDG